MQKLYAEQKRSLYEIQKELNVAHDTLYRYVREPNKIKSMPMYLLEGIAELEGLDALTLRNKMLEFLKEKEQIKEEEKENEL